MYRKFVGEVSCIRCGYCCGFHRDSHFGGCSYSPDEQVPDGVAIRLEDDGSRTIPVDKEDVCIYLKPLDNGFAVCTIHDKRPKMCRLYYCQIETKLKALSRITKYLKDQCKGRDSEALKHLIG